MLALMQWDLETEAPKMALNRASKTLESISELSYNMVVNDEFKKMIYDIDVEKLNEIDKKLILETRKEIFEKMGKIPVEEFSKYTGLKTIATMKWQEAKQNNCIKEYNYI